MPPTREALVEALDRSMSWAEAGCFLRMSATDVRRMAQALGLRPAGHRLPEVPPAPDAWEEPEERRAQRSAAARERWARWRAEDAAAAAGSARLRWEAPDLRESIVLSRRLPVSDDHEWEALHGAALPSSGRSAAEWARVAREG